MPNETFPLFVVIVLFLASLFGAFVLFKVLQSTAVVTTKEYQLGGAMAGFFVIFGLLYWSLSNITSKATEDTPWTLEGTVIQQDGSHPAFATVGQHPVVKVDPQSGSFLLPEVRMPNGALPILDFGGDSTHPTVRFPVTKDMLKPDPDPTRRRIDVGTVTIPSVKESTPTQPGLKGAGI